MSSVQEIEAALPKLSRAEMEEIRALIDDLLEDQLDLADDVKAKLDQSRREVSSGKLIRENGRTLGVTARPVTLADTQKALEDFP